MRPDLDDEVEGQRGGKIHRAFARSIRHDSYTTTYGTNNRINFAVGRVPLYYMEMRQERSSNSE